MKKITISLFGYFACMSAYAISINADEPRTIVADRIEYDFKAETIKTSGNTEIVNE